MNVLSTVEKQKFEELFGMASGYVLNFNDRSYAEFFKHDVGIDIDDPRYAFNGTSKAKRLRAFWQIESATTVGKALERLLEVWRHINEPGNDEKAERRYEECLKITSRLLGREIRQENESDFLKRDFGDISIDGLGLSGPVQVIMEARVKEAIGCVSSGAHLSAIFMCGSILEGLLLSAAINNPAAFNQASSSPKQKDTGKVKQFQDWSLANLIDVSHEVNLIRLDVKKFGHAVRDFRNYIHPFEQMTSRFTPDEHTAEICLQVLRAAIAGLKAHRGIVPT